MWVSADGHSFTAAERVAKGTALTVLPRSAAIWVLQVAEKLMFFLVMIGGSNSVVESQPSKLLVAGSIPVSRSKLFFE
jgi:hypothetical protein